MREQAIVTGGASGIGLALGAALVGKGWNVVLADLNGDEAEEQARQLAAAGPGSAQGAGVDVRDRVAVREIVQRTHALGNRLDLLANVVGGGFVCEPDELDLEHWDWAIDLNLRSAIYGCHAAYPLMKAHGRGVILNVASDAGIAPMPGQIAPYSTTKCGVVGLSLALRSAGADYGVQVNVLCPGNTDTPALDVVWPQGLPRPAGHVDAPTLRRGLEEAGMTPLGPERLAAAALRGIERDQPVIVVGSDARLLWCLARFSPRLASRAARKLTQRSRTVSQRQESVRSS